MKTSASRRSLKHVGVTMLFVPIADSTIVLCARTDVIAATIASITSLVPQVQYFRIPSCHFKLGSLQCIKYLHTRRAFPHCRLCVTARSLRRPLGSFCTRFVVSTALPMRLPLTERWRWTRCTLADVKSTSTKARRLRVHRVVPPRQRPQSSA